MFEFKKLRESDLQRVLDWRTHPDVSKNMLTEVEYDLEKQKKWFEQISKNPKFSYWVVYFNGRPIGVVNTADFDPVQGRTSLGFYVGDEEFRSLGGFVLIYVYNYLFKVLKIRTIFGEAVEGASILKLHASFGYKKVGIRKEGLKKDGKTLEVHLLELNAEDWLKQKKYEKYVAKFEA